MYYSGISLLWGPRDHENYLVISGQHKTKKYDLGILFRRQCFIWWNQNMLYFWISNNIKQNQAFRFFWDTWAPLHKTFCRSFLRQKSGNSGKKNVSIAICIEICHSFFYGKKKSGNAYMLLKTPSSSVLHRPITLYHLDRLGMFRVVHVSLSTVISFFHIEGIGKHVSTTVNPGGFGHKKKIIVYFIFSYHLHFPKRFWYNLLRHYINIINNYNLLV